MALINCPDCDKQVSSNAPACPNCGAPIATASAPPPESPTAPEVQTVEQTGKKWKALELFGVGMTFGGCVISGILHKFGYGGFGVAVVLAGMATWGFASVSAWWDHG